MWGFFGVAGFLSVILTGLWYLAYFRYCFGPFSDEDSWWAGIVNIRVHQLMVLAGGTMLALMLGKFLSICMQFLFLTARMGRVHKRVESLAQRTKDRQFIWTQQLLEMVSATPRSFGEDPSRALVSSPRRILICQASVGAGHKRAAEALEAALRLDYPDIDVKTIDVMDPQFADRVFTYFYKSWYLALVSGQTIVGSFGNTLIGFFFDRSNVIVKGELTGGGFLNNRRLCMTMILNFLDFLCDFEPDMIVHTHFLAAEIIAGLRRHNGYTVPQFTVITDMDVHAWWYQQPCEKYFVPRDLAQYQLELAGVPSEDIMVTGIPILPCFGEAIKASGSLTPMEKRGRFHREMDCELDMWESPEDHRPILLVMSGGPSTIALYKSLLHLRTPSIIVVVCGRFGDLRAELEQFEIPDRHRVKLVGFTKTMHELMMVSDVIVSKPGGLITSEALACGLMLVIVDPYAGQEERNASMLLEEGAAIQIHNHELTAFRLDPILSDLDLLQKYKSNAKKLARPNAARSIVKCIVQENLTEAAVSDIGSEPGNLTAGRVRTWSGCSMVRDRTESIVSASPLNWFESPETFQPMQLSDSFRARLSVIPDDSVSSPRSSANSLLPPRPSRQYSYSY